MAFFALAKQKLRYVLLHTSVIEVLLIASLVLAKYLPNSDFSYPAEVLLPIWLFGVLGTFAFYGYKYLFKSSLAAHAAALPLAYGFYGYSYAYPRLSGVADRLLPQAFETAFADAIMTTLVWGVVFGLIAFAIVKVLLPRLTFLKKLPLLQLAVFVICFIFASQVVKVGQRLWAIRHQLNFSYQSQIITKPDASAKMAAQPNIYYLVFDRYANQDTLAKDYNYDNAAMVAFLENQGFVTRDGAYANYPFTTQSVSSTLATDYNTGLAGLFAKDAEGFQTAFPYRTILDNPPVAATLKEHGYRYNQLSSWWDFTRDIPTADSEPTQSFRLRLLGFTAWLTDLQRDLVNKSILSPLLLKGATFKDTAIVKYDKDNNPKENFDQQLAALKAVALTSVTQKAPVFTFAHILSPHDPYVFTETGDEPTYSVDRNDDGIDEAAKYAKQLTYVNTRFQDMLGFVRQKDPGAVVIIQADEGPYPKQFRGEITPGRNYDPINLPLPQMRQKFGILASYYMPDTPPEVVKEQLTSSVNAFRFVFNRYLGYDMTYLPDCQFSAGNKYSLYTFHLVSDKLKDIAVPKECAPYQ